VVSERFRVLLTVPQLRIDRIALVPGGRDGRLSNSTPPVAMCKRNGGFFSTSLRWRRWKGGTLLTVFPTRSRYL